MSELHSHSERIVDSYVEESFAVAFVALQRDLNGFTSHTLIRKKELVSEVNSWLDFVDPESIAPRYEVSNGSIYLEGECPKVSREIVVYEGDE